MNDPILKIPHLILSAILSLSLFSCGDKTDEPEYDGPPQRCVLLYAVASNNLYSNLISDKKEIATGAKNLNLSKLSMMVYEVTPSGNPKLSELRRIKRDSCAFVIVKEYDRELYSTDPARIREVIEDVRTMKQADNYGLILWSHGTGIDPSYSTHGKQSDASEASVLGDQDTYTVNCPALYSFGSDRDPEKDPRYYDEIDVDELADAIPDGMFDFIWFDACYMSGIETVYEMRDKCDSFVGYPTEVYTPGMPYDLTIPYIMREKPDLKGAADAFFNYYEKHPSSSYRVATVAVMDMKYIEDVADYCAGAYSDYISPSTSGLQVYSRGEYGPFYDFGQFTRMVADMNPEVQSISEFDKLMDKFVVYKSATDVDFNLRPIAQNNYSGLSCFRYLPENSSDKMDYYRQLDWYKRVYPKDM